jgi:uroporphyrinogen decarboxylase
MTSMKPRERFVTALRCGIPDRVPVYDFIGGRELQRQLLGYSTELYDAATQAKLAGLLGFDAFPVFLGGFCGVEDQVHAEGSKYVDEWGVTYVKHGWPIMTQTASPIRSRADWNNYTIPNPRATHRTRMIREAALGNPDELAVLAILLGPLTMMYWYLMDAPTLSTMLYDDPELVREMCRAYVLWAVEAVRLAVAAGSVDAFYLADDWGGGSGLLMSPKHLREFFLPPYREIVGEMRRLGIPVIMHNDGKIWDVLDDLVATGVNSYHPVEKAAGMDLAVVKQRYAGRICPIGNINNKTTMVHGTPDDVRREAIACLRIGAPGGGYILATDHSLHDDIPLDNIRAYVEIAHRYGEYPLNLPVSDKSRSSPDA